MWAIKNFVRGPSAAVAFWPGPYPGASRRKPIGHAAMPACGQRATWARSHAASMGAQPCGQRAGGHMAISTLVGGNVGNVHTTRSLAGHVAMWPCGHDHARAFCMV